MKKASIVLVTLPFVGHVFPMLELAKQLSERGVHVIYTNTMKWIESLRKCSDTHGITFYPYSDGVTSYDKEMSVDEQLHMIGEYAPSSLQNIISQETENKSQISCIVYNSFAPWVLDVAAYNSIPTAFFWTQPVSAFLLYNFVVNNHWSEKGVVKLPEEVHIGGLPKFTKDEIPSHFSPDSPSAILRELVMSQFRRLHEATWILVNTVEKLELEEIQTAKKMKLGAQILAIYIYIPREIQGSTRQWNKASYNCSEWLNARNPKSVVYVAFGSMAEMSELQNEEIAKGLLSAGLPFLWVKRSKKEGEEGRTPECLRELKEEQGLVVEWCSQKEVLSHESIGVFVSHCGWNSCLEAISLGVPFICFPQWSEQTLNAKYISQKWKNGICLEKNHEGTVRSQEIQKCIVDVMKGGVGTIVRENADMWKRKVMKDMSLLGSSNCNIDRFISEATNWKFHGIDRKENASKTSKS